MKKRTISLILALTVIMSCFSVFTVVSAETEEDPYIIYKQNFNDSAIPAGSTYVTTSSGKDGIDARHTCWTANDANSKNGSNYKVFQTLGGSNTFPYGWMIVQDGQITPSARPVQVKKDIIVEFSFKGAPNRPDRASDAWANGLAVNLNVNIAPYSSTLGWNSDAAILTIPVGGQITAYDGTGMVNAAAFATEKQVWYDVKVVTNMSTTVPTYSAYIKKSADASFTTLVEGKSFPSDADYSGGLGINGLIKFYNQTVAALDDVQVRYVTNIIALADAENGSLVFTDGEGTTKEVYNRDEVSVKITPDEGYRLKKVSVSEQDMTALVENGVLTFNATEDSTVEAEFEEIPAVAPSVTTGDAKPSVYGTKSAIIVYGTVNEFTTAANVQYGIKLWENDKSAALTLPASSWDEETKTGTPEIATPGKVFAIKVFGDGYITSGKTFNACTYVGDTEGDAKSVTVE